MADTEKKPDPAPVQAAQPQPAADAKTKGPKQTNAGERS